MTPFILYLKDLFHAYVCVCFLSRHIEVLSLVFRFFDYVFIIMNYHSLSNNFIYF